MAEDSSQERNRDEDQSPPGGLDPEAGLAGSGFIETNTENPIPETKMEVHHHPQLDHKPKPWKEYLLEGLMIFIAVMMGFIAENIREGITDKEHVRELVSQLVQDLRNDTLQLDKIYQAETKIVQANDGLVELLQHPFQKENTGQLQEWIVRSHSLWPFYPSTGAIAAIKNELHLKQFSSSKMIGLIAEYEKHIDLLHTVQEITLQYQRTYLDPFLLQHFTTASLDAAFNKSPGINAESRNLSQDVLTQLGSDMILVRINTNELLADNRQLRTDALNLLQYVREQYPF